MGQARALGQLPGIAFELHDMHLTVRSSQKAVLQNISLQIAADARLV